MLPDNKTLIPESIFVLLTGMSKRVVFKLQAASRGRFLSRPLQPSGITPVVRFGSFALLASVWLAANLAGAAETAAAPEWKAQVEADWLLQDAKRMLPPAAEQKVRPEDDAMGGCDGVKNGQWGFHTEAQDDPWWQVDLQARLELERVVLYNRCDAFAERNSRIRVLVSDDGQNFRQVYQHDGTVFYGYTDHRPLVVKLEGVAARFVRLALPGYDYFHLDEVEVYAAGKPENAAFGKPATQSSTSQWSKSHAEVPSAVSAVYPVAQVLARGLKLADSQRRLGAQVEKEAAVLGQLKRQAENLPPEAPVQARRELYFRAHWAVRALALRNPLLNFDALLFVKRAPTMFPHMSDQHYGWWSRPGGGVWLLESFKTGQPQARCLTSDMPAGSFIGPELSYDGRKVLFACCRFYPQVADMEKVDKEKLPADCFYNLHEMNLDGTGRRRLTQGRYDDFDARYLPNGEILFLSTRRGLALQASRSFSDATRSADLPDSYVRCGGDSHRPVPVFTLHVMDADGRNIRPLSAFENFEWTPSVAADGRILYTRWDYIDRFNGNFFSLWSSGQDGSNPQLVYGNYTARPQVKCEARSIPGSSKLVITAGAHHSITGGSLCLLDRAGGTELAQPLTRLTPEVCFPETEGWPEHYYANPWPLSEEYFLVSWSARKLPPHARVVDERNPVNALGLYLYDAFGNQELLYRDPAISSMYPIPATARAKPPVQASLAQWDGPLEGRFLVQNVGQGLTGLAPGAIKRLRIVAVPPKEQPLMNVPVLGVSAEDPGKYVLGTVPVEPDGSACFRAPSGIPLFFQALDEQGVAVQTMRSLTYLQPGELLSCIGCHESRESAPHVARPLLAARRAPSLIRRGPEGSWPLRYDRLVQPVLDRLCVRCHSPGSNGPEAAKPDLTASHSYEALLAFGGDDLRKLAFERDRSVPGQGVCAKSRLWALLTAQKPHYETRLDADSLARLATWMDTYAQRAGHFTDAQEKRLVQLRSTLAGLFEKR
ncbi:MAG TPA: discoidin domain-containing protein [Dongiaceae bacterium]|nr:discoidin domain-containing protein [Dongiaceae bacterium]